MKTEQKQYPVSGEKVLMALNLKIEDTLSRIEGQIHRLRWFQETLNREGLCFEVQGNNTAMEQPCLICGCYDTMGHTSVRASWPDEGPDIGDLTSLEICRECVERFVPEIKPKLLKALQAIIEE